MINISDYDLEFGKFVSLDPDDSQMAEWNYRRMWMAINRGDSNNSKVYAIELVRWSVFRNTIQCNWN